MKCFPLAAFLVLAGPVGTAWAEISLEWRRVTPDSGTIESQHVADIPSGFKSWQLMVTTDTKWLGSELDVVLEQGSIYYDPIGHPNRSPPIAFLFDAFPSVRFTTHLSGTFAEGDQRQVPNFAPDPVRFGKNKTYTDKEITTVWGTPDALLETPGTHVIAMLTLSDDAIGMARGAIPVQATCIDPFAVEPCPPFILDSQIVNGEIIIPEPPLFGDITNNGYVDFDDLAVMLSNWDRDLGAQGFLDLTNDGVLNFDDLAVLLSAWTGPDPAGSPEAALENAALPEPSSMMLALLATLGLSFYRRRRRRAF